MGAIFSKLGDNLTNTGVAQPSGQTTYYDTPQAATEAASKQLPSTDSMIDYSDPIHPKVNTPSNLPRVAQPSFAAANANGGWLSPELSSKGKLLGIALSLAQGAGAGAAAASQGSPRTGYPSPLVGLSAGLNVPFENRQRQLELQNAEQEQELRRAQINALPQMQQLDRQLKQSEIDAREAQANRRENYTVPGVGLVTPDSTQPSGFKIVVPEPQKKGDMDSVGGRQAYMNQVDPSGNLLSPRERMGFIATGKWPTETTDRAPSLLQWISDSNSSDPNVASEARKNLASYRQVTADNHAARNPSEDGLTAAQLRSLKSDSQWNNLNKRMSALTQQYARQSAYDPDGAALIGKQIDDLATQADARKALLLQPGGAGRLRIKGSNAAPLLPSHAPSTIPNHPLVGQIMMSGGRKVKVVSVDQNGNAQVQAVQ